MSCYILLDYHCPECGSVAEALQPRPAPDGVPCTACPGTAKRALSPVRGRIAVTASRGKVAPRPPNGIDTQPLADGMPMAEWKQWRDSQLRGL